MRTFSRQGAAKSSILLSAGCLQQRGQCHRRTGERPLPDSGDSRTPRAALPISPAAIARHPEDRVAGELYQPGARAAHVGGADRPSRPGRHAGLRGREADDDHLGARWQRKTSLLHAGADRSCQDPDHNHQDPVTTVHLPGGEPGSVAKARTAARGRASDLTHDSPMASGRRRTARRRTPLNAVAFTGRTEIVMSEARSAGVQISSETMMSETRNAAASSSAAC